MNTYRYILSSNKIPKIDCPYCGAKKHWQRFIDTKTGYIYPNEYGKCDNDIKCGKWTNPEFNKFSTKINQNLPKTTKKVQKQTYIPTNVYQHFLNVNAKNNKFIANLEEIGIPESRILEMLNLYYLGLITDGEMKGATTFPFIDIKQNIVAVQVKHFNDSNHTDKSKKQHTSYLHSVLYKEFIKSVKNLPNWLKNYQKNTEKVTCLFGEHLLKEYPNNTIALVEAPKTAIYGTLYFGSPSKTTNYLWLATGSFSYFTLKRVKVLAGRKVILFPDLSNNNKAFNNWKQKANMFCNEMTNTKFYVNNYLENIAKDTDRIKGLDLADYLHGFNWQEFQGNEI